LQKAKEGYDDLVLALQSQINEIRLKMAGMKERMNVEFDLDLEAVMSENPLVDEAFFDFKEEDLKELVHKQKDRLDKIGPINPMAMEAYDEIKIRYDFITTQKEDLIKAKDSLLSTISEIDLVARETFLDAFGKIKENFVRVFRSLFTEQDDCDLTLVDPENPLESAIEIMAKPKGKRPLTINQLSGGEKTLTATSLLFSIYLLKPAPFCIFDEVDAPLDDANIDKFNQIIQKFSAESQFIIVTHNKRTMASTDIIYGITMIEAGVSRVVPVDLRELTWFLTNSKPTQGTYGKSTNSAQASFGFSIGNLFISLFHNAHLGPGSQSTNTHWIYVWPRAHGFSIGIQKEFHATE